MPRPPTAPKLGLGLGLNARQRGGFQQAAQQGAGGSAAWLAKHPGVQQRIANSPGGGMQGQRIQNFMQTGQNQMPQPPVGGRPNFSLQQTKMPATLGMTGGNMPNPRQQPMPVPDNFQFNQPQQQQFGFGGGPGYSLGGNPPQGAGTGFGMGGGGQQYMGKGGQLVNSDYQGPGTMGGGMQSGGLGGGWGNQQFYSQGTPIRQQQSALGMQQMTPPGWGMQGVSQAPWAGDQSGMGKQFADYGGQGHGNIGNPFNVNPGMQKVIANRMGGPGTFGGGMRY